VVRGAALDARLAGHPAADDVAPAHHHRDLAPQLVHRLNLAGDLAHRLDVDDMVGAAVAQAGAGERLSAQLEQDPFLVEGRMT